MVVESGDPAGNYAVRTALDARLANLPQGEPPPAGLMNDLAAYALNVMVALIRTGRIFTECARKGRPLGIAHHIPGDDVDEVATDAVVEGLGLFCHNESGTRWRPVSGAAPTSYLIGACILCYPSIYRRYWRLRAAACRVVPVGVHPEDELWREEPSAESSTLGMESLRDALSDIRPGQRAALLLIAQGYTADQGATQLGITPKAFEQRVWRARNSLRTRFGGRSVADILARP